MCAEETAPTPQAPKIVEAQAFVLKNAEGKVMATLDLTDEGFPSLKLYGKNGNEEAPLLDLGVTHGPSNHTEWRAQLTIYDQDKGLSATLSQWAIKFFAAQSKPGVEGLPRTALTGPRCTDLPRLFLADGDANETIHHTWPDDTP